LGGLLPPPPQDDYPPIIFGVPDQDDGQDGAAPPPKYLREAKGYMEVLFHFTKVVVMASTFIAHSNRKLLSHYMSPNLEAFLVLTYVNNYDAWKAEMEGEQFPSNQDATSEEDEEEDQENEENNQQLAGSKRDRDGNSRLVSPVSKAKKKFTANPRGKGKFKGWSEEGMVLYKKLTKIVKQQRADKKLGEDFEALLLEEFLSRNKKWRAASDEDNNGEGAEADEDDDWLDAMVTTMKNNGRIPKKNNGTADENGKE
jgi:hypothetical protein